MKKIFVHAVCLITTLLLTGLAMATSPPAVGEKCPDIRLSFPKNPEHLAYLGLVSQGNSFSPAQIKADMVIIQIFSMYCPHCQKEAPNVNGLYRSIETNPDFKGKIKIIGIGVGNSEFETDYFRKSYDIRFPLFADPDFVVHKLVGEVRTPYFIVIRLNKDGSHAVVYSKLGSIGDPAEFLKSIKP
jgi:peroxiredoxin